MENLILGKDIEQWTKEYPLFEKLINLEEAFWLNEEYKNFEEAMEKINIGEKQVKDAEDRLLRFAPYIMSVFPETKDNNGLIESKLAHIPNMKKYLEQTYDFEIPGDVFLKCDSHLAISGSIKARGGIYEVLKYAEDLAVENGLLKLTDNYEILDSEKARNFFSYHTIAVGSTGNLGLSIGIISAKLGFNVFVHMSSDAKQWKKDLLRSRGVNVVEYEDDYSKAVEEGRRQSDADPMSYFVDDENSVNLFMGYAVAANRLKKQFDEQGIKVDNDHPLFVYLPCGVGGGPGGVAFGLKLVFRDNVHCFFAEPTHSPCMLIGCMTNLHDKVSVGDFGIDNKTVADGLAVGRPSGFVGKILRNLLSGDYSVDDNKLFKLLKAMSETEDIFLEPSALAGVAGIEKLLNSEVGSKYIKDNNLEAKLENATHMAWATGGSMVPQEEMDKYVARG